MLFRVEIWCTPIENLKAGQKQRAGAIRFIAKMALVQRIAAIFVTRALQTTLF